MLRRRSRNEAKSQSLHLIDLSLRAEFWLQALEVASDLRQVSISEHDGIARLEFSMSHAQEASDFFGYYERAGKIYTAFTGNSPAHPDSIICIDQTGMDYTE